MENLITPQLKDSILTICISQGKLGRLQQVYFTDIDLDFDSLIAVLEHFQTLGLLGAMKYTRQSVLIRLNVEAHDFKRHGGFHGQEELFQQNIQKLLLEIEELRPSAPEKAKKIIAIAADIATFLGLVIH